MNPERREQINQLADSVRVACGLSVPVDVDLAVARLSGEVVMFTDADYEAKIERVADGFRISLRDDLHENRQRFTIAHELGHLLLHMGYVIDEEKWRETAEYRDSAYYRYGHNVEEYEAHEFAAALLMPANEFKHVAAKHRVGTKYKIQPIADHFEVSTHAAATRGRWLGLFNWE
jgi:predicted transcriptional regulator